MVFLFNEHIYKWLAFSSMIGEMLKVEGGHQNTHDD